MFILSPGHVDRVDLPGVGDGPNQNLKEVSYGNCSTGD